MNNKSLKELSIEKRLENIERLVAEIHAKLFVGNTAELKPGCPEFRIAAREFLRGNKEPMKALGGKKFREK